MFSRKMNGHTFGVVDKKTSFCEYEEINSFIHTEYVDISDYIKCSIVSGHDLLSRKSETSQRRVKFSKVH